MVTRSCPFRASFRSLRRPWSRVLISHHGPGGQYASPFVCLHHICLPLVSPPHSSLRPPCSPGSVLPPARRPGTARLGVGTETDFACERLSLIYAYISLIKECPVEIRKLASLRTSSSHNLFLSSAPPCPRVALTGLPPARPAPSCVSTLLPPNTSFAQC